ncbi:MAG: magnesium transporter [Hydrogenothermaceae bacterium]|nr:magnesium transporter [Hydrogenothermaceae bacterium]
MGIITVEYLFSSEPEKKAKDIMDTNPPTVSPHTDQEVAAWQAVQREEYALAVVDHDGYFLGIIPPKTLLQILLQEHEEDLSIISGLVESKERIIKSNSTPLKDRILQRLPWLLIGLIGSFLSAGIVDIFEEEIKKHVMLAFFIPTVVYLADAIGTQTEAIVVGFVSLDLKVSDIPLKETLTTASIGFILFIVSLVVISTFWKDENVAFVISLAILLASTIAGFIVSVFPIILDKLHIDPAYGGGPIATCTTGLCIYNGVLHSLLCVHLRFLNINLIEF